jgi:oligoribonuclease
MKMDMDQNLELNQPLVWIDLETTGLALDTNVILEVACIITDGSLEKIVEGPNLVIKRSDEILLKMSDWCWRQHNKTGLVNQCRSRESIKIKNAENILLEFVRKYIPNKATAILAGNSVHFDKEFIRKEMPELFSYFHHRIVDVSTINELVHRWFPTVIQRKPVKKGDHRALADLYDSIAELKFYRKNVLRER